MDIRDIFENKIKIEAKVMSLESLFNNQTRVRNTDYKPSYQRNYVWDDEKATYFIESILLGTEIPPLVYFRNADKAEIIDGRQRYQTILRFKNNEFKLRKNGLHKLGNIGIANKPFKDIGFELQDLFWDTKLRIIEFSFHSREGISDDIEELVKKEIFKRYNSGITPLKPTEIDNAIYLEDNLNAFLKKKIQEDEILNRDISNIFHFEKNNIEVILKKIRQLLVQHEIPIKYYSVKKQSIISKFYDALFEKIDVEDIENIFNSLVTKLNLLEKIKSQFPNGDTNYNRLISECLFWGFSILENENVDLNKLNEPNFINEVVKYLSENINSFRLQRSSFAKELYERYSITARFFENKFNLSLGIYLDTSQDFKQRNKDITPINEERISFDELRINKPEPSSIAITDICRLTDRQRFLLRPPYQRKEVINKKKSSAIIESILLGIKIPPIFIFKREDNISEVLDGQQRLLSILGFINKPYLNENGKKTHSDKKGFSLYLKNGILNNLHGKKFNQLSIEQQHRILNFDLWVIEIDKKNNKNFEPIDLFVRLNNKPYPIKEDTFEMWNSYISRDIIDTIKAVHKNHNNWFYFRKNNSRMEDENIYTALAYFQYCRDKKNLQKNGRYNLSEIDIYKIGTRINFRVKSKNEITKILEDGNSKNDFIKAINHLEFEFIRKLKELSSNKEDSSIQTLNKNLDNLFLIGNGRRTQQSFYALWYFLFDIPLDSINKNKEGIRNDIKNLFQLMTNVEDKTTFENKVQLFKNNYSNGSENTHNTIALLKEISTISIGIKKDEKVSSSVEISNKIRYKYLNQSNFHAYSIDKQKLEDIEIDPESTLIDLFDSKSKILISRNCNYLTRFSTTLSSIKLAFSYDIIGLVLKRPNFLSKYVLALLSSRYFYFMYYKQKKAGSDDLKLLSISDFNEMKVPIISIDEQNLFANIIDYIVCSQQNINAILFFERILDAMVYEINFKNKFLESNIQIIKYVSEFPILENIQIEYKKESVNKLYDTLSNPEHPLGGHLLSLLNIPEIIEVESRY